MIRKIRVLNKKNQTSRYRNIYFFYRLTDDIGECGGCCANPQSIDVREEEEHEKYRKNMYVN